MVQISPGPLQPASGDVNRNISNITDPLPHLYSHAHQDSHSLSMLSISGITQGVMYVTEEKTGFIVPSFSLGYNAHEVTGEWGITLSLILEPCLLGCKLSRYHIRVLLPPNPKWPEESPSILPFLHPDYSGAICCFPCRSLGLAHRRHSLSSFFTWNTRIPGPCISKSSSQLCLHCGPPGGLRWFSCWAPRRRDKTPANSPDLPPSSFTFPGCSETQTSDTFSYLAN